jgi:hypothetical protein
MLKLLMTAVAKILDRDMSNWNDLLTELATDINLGSYHKLRVTYWDKMSRNYDEITFDQKLLHAIDMYWEIRRLSLQVCVIKKNDSEFMHDVGRQQSMPYILQGGTDAPAKQINAQTPLKTASPISEPHISKPQNQNSTSMAWMDDDIEYVGLDDEDPFKNLLSDSECDGDVECVGLEDDLVVDDAWGCEIIIHATDLENPTIAVGINSGDGDTFKKAIRQYAIKGEYKIAAAYSESTRYRGYYKAERCKWKIHASRVQGGSTWNVPRN